MDSILDIRKALGVSQVEMAEQLGLNQSTISRFERKEIVPDKRTMIAARALLNSAKQDAAA